MRIKWTQISIMGVLGLLIIAVTIFLFSYKATPYPIEFTVQQNVIRDPAVFHIDQPIDVEGKFINKTTQNVTFTAAIHWILDSVEGQASTDIVQLGLLVTLPPGCTDLGFSNNPPPQVVEITKKLFDAGKEKVTWRLSGNNLIITPSNGGSKEFRVDSFTYIKGELPKYEDRRDNNKCTALLP